MLINKNKSLKRYGSTVAMFETQVQLHSRAKMILAIGLVALAITVAPSLTEETTCPGLKQYFDCEAHFYQNV